MASLQVMPCGIKQSTVGVNTVKSNISEADEILKFKQLLDAGVITQEEFDAKKQQILNFSSDEFTKSEIFVGEVENNIDQAETIPSSAPASVPLNGNRNEKKPVYKKAWFWVVIVLFCLVLIVKGVDSSDGDTGEESSTGEQGGTETEDNSSGSSNEIGSKNNPYVLDAETWYENHCEGSNSTKYIDKWVKVTGTVLSISDYGNLKGYYLSGGPGYGLVCWVKGSSTDANYGQQIEYIGKVSVEDSTQVEISDGEIKSASWPTNKPKSPVTISNWTSTRDSVGGVEWNFKFTNNTDKVVKYITMEWACYNAVGDPVYDEITGKSTVSVKYTGPLEAGKTTNLLRNTTLFYSYSYKSAKLAKLTVEFMDGTIICLSSQGYSDIIAEN